MLNCCNIQATNFHTAVILDPLIIWHRLNFNLFIFKKKRGRGYNKATKKKYQCMALNLLLSENEIKNDVCFVLRFTFTFLLPLVRKWLMPKLDRCWTSIWKNNPYVLNILWGVLIIRWKIHYIVVSFHNYYCTSERWISALFHVSSASAINVDSRKENAKNRANNKQSFK